MPVEDVIESGAQDSRGDLGMEDRDPQGYYAEGESPTDFYRLLSVLHHIPNLISL